MMRNQALLKFIISLSIVLAAFITVNAQKNWRVVGEFHFQAGSTVNNRSDDDQLRNYFSFLAGRRINKSLVISIGAVYTQWKTDAQVWVSSPNFKIEAQCISPQAALEFTSPLNKEGSLLIGTEISFRKGVRIQTISSYSYSNWNSSFDLKNLDELNTNLFLQYNIKDRVLLQFSPFALVNGKSTIEENYKGQFVQNLTWKETRIDLFYFRMGVWF